MILSLAKRATHRLARQLRTLASASAPAPHAVVAPTARIWPEGTIENNRAAGEIFLGSNTHIRGRLFTYGHGGRITIGDWCYVGTRSEIWSMNSIVIGNRVLIAHDVNIHDGNAHPSDHQRRHRHYRAILAAGHPHDPRELMDVASAPIVIEDDVWISFGVTILKGVRVGARAIIAAGAVVTDDVPPDCLVIPERRNRVTLREGERL